MWPDLIDRCLHYPRAAGTELVRSLCGAFGLDVVDKLDSATWRLQAAKDSAKWPAVDAVVADSLVRLRSATPSSRRFAVIAPLPPAETGIANATVQTYRGYAAGVDIFTRFEDAYAYSEFTTEARRCEFGLNVYDVAGLPLALEKCRYQAIIVTLGNSRHNRFAAALLSTLGALPPKSPLFVHVHDPWLHDIWAWLALARGSNAAIEFNTIYGGRRRRRFQSRAADQVGALGLSALIKQAPVKGIIVNSRAAAALVEKDLKLAKLTIPIIEAFHPVFPPTVPMPIYRRTQSPIVVGTFGVPNRAKRTEIVHEAVRRLARRGLARELVVAGYGVSAYLDRLNLDRSFVRAVDAPGDTDLQALMAEVDVAVQLRRKDRGESSGIVPQLLALGKPVVVSSIGSFRELGDAVIQIDGKADPDDVARSILHAAGNSERLRQASEMYSAQHTPEIFMKVLEHAAQRLEP